MTSRARLTGAPEWVIAPVTVVARHAGARVGYVDLRSASLPSPVPTGARVLVCTDDIHGGNSVRVTLAALGARGAQDVGIATMANLSGLERIKVVWLFDARPNAWRPAECPLCASGSPALPARTRWVDLIASS